MGKNKRNKKSKNDEKIYTKLGEYIKAFFSKVRRSESTMDLSSLDEKMIQRLNDSGFKDISRNIKNKDKKSAFKLPFLSIFKHHNFVGNLIISLSIVIIILGTSLTGYLWLNGNRMNDLQVDTFSNLTARQKTPNISLLPTSITESGFIAEDSAFVVEIEGELKTKVQDALTITPEVSAQYSSEYKDGTTTITIKPDEDLVRGQKYQISLNSGTKYGEDGEIIKDLDWIIPVEPLFAVMGTTPRDGVTDIPTDTTIEFEFNHLNISSEQFGDYFNITPSVEGVFQTVGTKIVFLPSKLLETSTLYSVRLSSEFSNLAGEKLGEDTLFTFTTGYLNSKGEYRSSAIGWYDSRNFVTMVDEIILRTYSYDYDETTYKVYRLDKDKLMSYVLQEIDAFETIVDQEPIYTSTLAVEDYFRYQPGSNGLYYVTAQSGDDKIGKFVILSNLSILAYSDNETTEGWVFNLDSAQPVGGVNISVYKDREIVDVVNTDSRGYFRSVGSDLVLLDNSDNLSLWSNRLNNLGYDWYVSWYDLGSGTNYSNKISLDKPLYMAGDEVKGFGIIKQIVDNKISAGTSISSVTIKVTDKYTYYDMLLGTYTDTPLYEEVVDVDENFGTYEFKYVIPKSFASGTLNISVYDGDKYLDDVNISIGDYVKPTYKYEVNIVGPTHYLNGDTVNAVIQASDYSGTPLSNEKVKVSVYRIEVDEDTAMSYGYVDLPSWGGDDLYIDEIVELNADGYAEFSFTPYGNSSDTHYYKYRVQVNANDETQNLLASAYVNVCEIGTDVEPVVVDKSFNEIGDDVSVRFLSKGSWDRTVTPNKTVYATFIRKWYEKVELEPEYDPYLKRSVQRYTYISQSTTLPEVELKTDENGVAEYLVEDVSEGYYAVRLRYDGVEEMHNNVFSVWEKDLDYGYTEIVYIESSSHSADVGDTVDIKLYSSEKVNGIYLVSGHDFMDSKMIALDPDEDYEETISVDQSHYPSFDVCYYGVVQDLNVKGWIGKCTYISVDSDYGTLKVNVKTDKQDYDPGEEVKVEINVKDLDGKPVKALLNVKAVDQSLVDLGYYWEFDTEDLRNSVVTSLISGGKYFGTNGIFVNDVMFGRGAGGGGGMGDTREDFVDTAYWNSKIITDNKGNAKTSFTLPDNLTTWNISAIAVAVDEGVGVSSSKIKSNLARFMHLKTPSFVRLGDVVEMEMVLGNYDSEFDGDIKLTCLGCVNEELTKTINLPQKTRKTTNFTLEPIAGYDNLEILATLKDSEEVVDQVKVYIPVYSDSAIGQTVQTSLIKSNEKSERYIFDIEDFDEYNTFGELILSRTFAIEQFNYPADVSVLSTKNLSNAILHNSFMIKNFDYLNVQVSKPTLKNETKELLSYLRNNQDSSGGFGWFDYDAVSLESTVTAARAFRSASDAEVEVNSFVGNSMRNYFINIFESDKYSIHDKILAFDGLSLVDVDTAQMYSFRFYDLYRKSEEAKRSALTIAVLMDAFNNIGNTGSNKQLVNDLVALSINDENMVHWEDTNSIYRVGQDPLFVTAFIYNSISSLEEWDLKYEIRNWLMRELEYSSINSEKYNEMIYYIAVGDQDAVYFVQNSAEIEIKINGKAVSSFIFDNKDNFSRHETLITSDLLVQGENVVEIIKKGDTELYSILTINQRVQPSTEQLENFVISRKYIDATTGAEVPSSEITEDNVVKVQISVTPMENFKDVIIRDFLPTGFTPVTLDYRMIPLLIYQNFFNNFSPNVNKWGTSSSDYMSFSSSEMVKGQTYTFEYLVMPGSKGDLSGAGTQVYLNLLPDVQSFLQADRVVIK